MGKSSRIGRARRRGKSCLYAACDTLESRKLLATVIVSTNLDGATNNDGNTSSIAALIANPGTDGQISLREAMLAANNTAGTDAIHFSLAPGSIIRPLSKLPDLTQPTHLIGGTGGAIGVQISGNLIASSPVGLTLRANGNIIRGLSITHFGDGISLINSDANLIVGSYVGVAPDGVTAGTNSLAGILLNTGSDNNTIGGSNSDDRNLVSDNLRSGIEILSSANNRIVGNWIGPSSNGDSLYGDQGTGIQIHGVSSINNRIGSGVFGERNVISGNKTDGIVLASARQTKVAGNFIGLNALGNASLPNGFAGVLLTYTAATPAQGATQNIIGGTASGEGNTISGNTKTAVQLINGANANAIQGNFIGTDPAGLVSIANGDGDTSTVGAINIYQSHHNTIGGSDADDGLVDGDVLARNIISGNDTNGIFIEGGSSGTVVAGNHIGTSVTGAVAVPNTGTGVVVVASTNTTIGGLAAGSGNVISGNDDHGIEIGINADGTAVLSNFIGTNDTGLAAIPNASDGIHVHSALTSTIGTYSDSSIVGMHAEWAGNVIAGNGGNGIHIISPMGSFTSVLANLIGVGRDGVTPIGNGVNGVLASGAPNTVIGKIDLNAATRRYGGNVISANVESGVVIDDDSTASSVAANIIGLDRTGTLARGNGQSGIYINDSVSVRVGSVLVADGEQAGNVISSNGGSGIWIERSTGTYVWGNAIGTAADRETARGNQIHGIHVSNSSSQIKIMPVVIGEPNVIAFNGAALGLAGHGVLVDANCSVEIRKNQVHSNTGRAIDVGNDSFDINDHSDADTGELDRPNYPTLVRVDFDSLPGFKVMDFELNGAPGTYTIDVYASDELGKSGFGDAKRHLTTLNLTIAPVAIAPAIYPEGMDSFWINVPVEFRYITATATDALGRTSEFSIVDSDADGLADQWEIDQGIDVNEDGIIDAPLIGARPLKKDIFIEIDAMPGLFPSTTVLDDLKTAFRAAPQALIQNPDNSLEIDGDPSGITLHFINSNDQIPRKPWLRQTYGWPVAHGTDVVGNDAERRTGTLGFSAERASENWPNILKARQMTHRHASFVEQSNSTGRSGVAYLQSNYLIVSLGSWGPVSDNDIAATFMHELGHTLGLGHGGQVDEELNYKPNYLSVMNYSWQLDWHTAAWTSLAATRASIGPANLPGLGYSTTALPPINETSVNESIGLGGPAGIYVPVYPHGEKSTLRPVLLNGAQDLDGIGGISSTPQAINLNGDTYIDSSGNVVQMHDTLHGHEDWSNLYYSLISGARNNVSHGISFLDAISLRSSGPGAGQIGFDRSSQIGVERTQLARIPVVRIHGNNGSVSVQYRIAPGGSATSGTDFTPVTGTVLFADGEYIKYIEVPLIDDDLIEADETFTVELFNPVGASLYPTATAVVHITEPMAVGFSQTAISIDEDAGTVALALTLGGETGEVLSESISIDVSDLLSGTAIAGVDYTFDLSEVTFPAGSAAGATRYVNLTLINRFGAAPERNLTLELSEVDSYAAIRGNGATLAITIAPTTPESGMVKDIVPGAGSAFPVGEFANTYRSASIGSHLLFVANDPEDNSYDLWRSDGTAAGTQLVLESPNILAGDVWGMMSIGSRVVFVGYGNEGFSQLWTSDGTAAGTVMLRDFGGVDTYTSIDQRLTVGNLHYFIIRDQIGSNATDFSLWRTDGTVAGTQQVVHLPGVWTSGNAPTLTAVGDTVYFGLWDFDYSGTLDRWNIFRVEDAAAPTLVHSVEFNGSTQYLYPYLVGGPLAKDLYLLVSVQNVVGNAINSEVWHIDNTTGDANRVATVSNKWLYEAAQSGSTLYYAVTDPVTSQSVIRTLGPSGADVAIATVNYIGGFIPAGDGMFFTDPWAPNTELWYSKGTPQTTLIAGTIPYYFVNYAVFDGTLYFESGGEVWKSNGTTAGTKRLIPAMPNAWSTPSQFVATKDSVFYVGETEASGRELWRIDTPPIASTIHFSPSTWPTQITIDFNEDVSASVSLADFVVTNRVTGLPLPAGTFNLTYVAGLNRVVLSVNNGELPSGRYRLQVANGAIADVFGHSLSALQFDFAFQRGDVNGDGVVGFDDLLLLAQNYGQSGRSYAQGNLDRSPDGLVGFDDLLILAQSYGQSLPTLAASVSTPAKRRDKPATQRLWDPPTDEKPIL